MKRVIKIILSIIDIYLPAICFLIMFIVFITSIFFRYVLNDPIMWSEEVSTMCYIYIALLMAPYVYENNKFVSFAMVYDKLNEKGQMIFRLLGNTIIFLTFILLIRPTYIFLTTFKTVTHVLRLPYLVMFWPFSAMVILMICRSFYKIYQDVELILKQKSSALLKNAEDAKL